MENHAASHGGNQFNMNYNLVKLLEDSTEFGGEDKRLDLHKKLAEYAS